MNALHFFFRSLALGILLAAFFVGIINKVKAFFGGRKGKPFFQLYYDIAKLLGKGAVISPSTTWIFAAGPLLSLVTAYLALLLLPLGGVPSPLAFQGDFILVAYLLGIGRFFMILAALDTGSSFEGMGASREACFAALAEPALFLCFLALAVIGISGENSLPLSISGMFTNLPGIAGAKGRPEILLIPIVLFLLMLVETSRIPVDDPNTHLELTMIHEVIVLDHSGPDMAFIQYASALKLWFFASLLAVFVIPPQLTPLAKLGVHTATILGIAIIIGILESTMARIRLLRITQLLGGANTLAVLALLLTLMNR